MNNLRLYTTVWRNLISRMLDKRSQRKKSIKYPITFVQSTKKGKTIYAIKIQDSNYLWGQVESRQESEGWESCEVWFPDLAPVHSCAHFFKNSSICTLRFMNIYNTTIGTFLLRYN